ncbi:hypothetical protein PAE9249_04227 [Paenibacillus sp. CECT 9249]|uniref:pyridine nucleotide transhydrogenase n=1 Tax=Paenibacillus sp. CECT 9249 TaxID=2845385 RepID=UPI001E3150C1|nr:pyridine nucleotide transhydrogenase [Paenibacillus sp. CECT 9249]CAH0121694.1 hypothetical protein PAE9249_04227 [Paenibacillus sp. CECT 9249]
MKTCLIGHTGFVGSTLLTQNQFDDLYNSRNIDQIKGKFYDMVVCAGAPAVKWKANQEPEEDLENINYLINNLQEINTKLFILISTVDVYKHPVMVDEDTVIVPEDTDPYGRHRYYLENFVSKTFDNYLIVRLPGLFGDGLKKNFIYDLIHNNCLHLTHGDSVFQFYPLHRLWSDIQTAVDHSLREVNFSTEPVQAKEVARHCFNLNFDNRTEKAPVHYNMLSKHHRIFTSSGSYMLSKEDVLQQISDFARRQTF